MPQWYHRQHEWNKLKSRAKNSNESNNISDGSDKLNTSATLEKKQVNYYTVFHKKRLLFFIIHSNDDQFTPNFYQLQLRKY